MIARHRPRGICRLPPPRHCGCVGHDHLPAPRHRRRHAARAYAVTAVELSQAWLGAAVNLSFTTASPALLSAIFRYGGAAARIAVITLTVGALAGFPLQADVYVRRLAVGSFAEGLSGAASGAATLAVRPR